MISCTDSQQPARQSRVKTSAVKWRHHPQRRRQIREHWKIIESEFSAETLSSFIKSRRNSVQNSAPWNTTSTTCNTIARKHFRLSRKHLRHSFQDENTDLQLGVEDHDLLRRDEKVHFGTGLGLAFRSLRPTRTTKIRTRKGRKRQQKETD